MSGAPDTPDEAQLVAEVERLRAAGPGGVEGLVERLTEARWTVRRRVVAALAELGDAAIGPLCVVLRSRRDDEARIAAAVDALSASAGAAEAAAIALTGDDDPAVVTDAAQILGRRRATGAIPTLITLTTHADDNVAVGAIEALGRVGGRAAVDVLAGLLTGGNFFRIFPAIDVLGRSGDPRAVAPLASLLGDPRYAPEAARALGRTGDRGAAAPLAGLLGRPSDALVRTAAAALGELYERFRERYGETDLLDEALQAAAPASGARRAEACLAGASAEEQVALCRVLGAVGGEAHVPALTRLLEASPPVAAAAATALRSIGRAAERQLFDAIEAGDSARRRLLLPLAGARASAAGAARSCLDDPDAVVRAMACELLARIGDRAAAPALVHALGDANARVVHAATAAVQSLGGGQTEALVLEAARSPEPRVRLAALRIVAYFGYEAALELLLEALEGDEREAEAALQALAPLGDARALGALLAAIEGPTPRLRAAAARALGRREAEPKALERLRRALDDEDAWVRYYACQALGRLADSPSSGALAARLSDPAGQVRVAAIEALSHLADPEARAALSEAARSDDEEVRRAALLGLGAAAGAAALPALLEALASPDGATRLIAVSALAHVKGDAAVVALRRAAFGGDELAGAAALEILAARPEVGATGALVDLLHAALASAPAGGPPPPRAEQLLAALSRHAPGRIEGLLTALALADDEFAPRLTSALARMRHAVGAEALLDALLLPNVAARKAAATTLGALRAPAAREALLRASEHDPDPAVRRLADLALAGAGTA
ncbi:MAG: HEAT repeat domain-containing protein [Polyangiaceae bacterium]|nr:HEAT repeat domain-containing protein [Polyangiaceae bacterium]